MLSILVVNCVFFFLLILVFFIRCLYDMSFYIYGVIDGLVEVKIFYCEEENCNY